MNDRITVADGKYTFRLDTGGNFHSVSAYPQKAFASVQDIEVALGALIQTALDAIDHADKAERRLAEAVEALDVVQKACAPGYRNSVEMLSDIGISTAFLTTLEAKETTDAGPKTLTKSPDECDHAGWTFEKQGRRCFTCGATMADWGD